MADEATMQKSLEILEKAASEVSALGLDNVTVSEMFFAYGIRIGVVVEGVRVFDAARRVIDAMERQSLGD
ncbi:MAG TPA: hypothetical protein VGO22_09215 [Pseudorhizobium sp.]|nr:hypothetical protein [Pseudorhizobium sp.]